MNWERVQLDTNILLRYIQVDHPQHERTQRALRDRTARGDEFVVVPQNLVEFWAVSTRPALNNGLGLTTTEAKTEIESILRSFTLLYDTVGAFAVWFELVQRYGVSGKPTHDARLVATMLDNGIARLLTYNVADFARFSEIKVETPEI